MKPALRIGEQIELDLTHFAYGGDAVGRVNDLVVFVPFGAPGDRVRAKVFQVRPNHARARIEQVLVPGPGRREPHCRYFGVCGGCKLQHVDKDSQQAAKIGFITDALERIGGIRLSTPIEMAAGEEYGYRGRTRLHRARGRFGFKKEHGDEVVDIAQCPILAPELNEALSTLRGALKDRRTAAVEFALTLGEDGVACHPSVADLPTETAIRVGAHRYRVTADGFFQGHAGLIGQLVDAALVDHSGGHAVDLYAGVGLFSLPLRTRFQQVTAVEANPTAAGMARNNAVAAGLGITVLVFSVDDWLAAQVNTPVPTRVVPDLLLVDPPRTGVGPAMGMLAQLGAPFVAYVSCDPATLARDLKVMTGAGYEIRSIKAFDLFPQTTHVETVVQLARA